MNKNKAVGSLIEEILANGIGWVAGLLSVDVLKLFFIERKWSNAWGLFSKKTAVNSSTFNILEWILTAIIGFLVMWMINVLIRKVFFKKPEVVTIEDSKIGQSEPLI